MGFQISSLVSRTGQSRRRKLVWGALVVASSQHSHVTVHAFHATHAMHGSSLLLQPTMKSKAASSMVMVGPRQQQRNDRDETWLGANQSKVVVLSSQEILQLARKNAQRKRGSRAYISSWRHWMDHATRAIRQELQDILPHPVHVQERDKLSLELGIAADRGEMPSFSHPGARSGYALDYFCRARLLAGLIMQSKVGEELASLWIQEDPYRTIHVTSLGGGPGFDFVALAMAILFSQSATTTTTTDKSTTQSLATLNTTVLDYEVGWSDIVQAMNDATMQVLQQPNFHCQWGGRCDITQPLHHPSNQGCLAAITTTNIWTCQYCVAENAQKLRASNFVFFQDLWKAMPDQSMMILTETTPRLWPELYNALKESCPQSIQVSFPNHKGPQMFLRKCLRSSSSSLSSSSETKAFLSDHDRNLLKDFEEISAKHEERHQSGWKRQVKKQFKVLIS